MANYLFTDWGCEHVNQDAQWVDIESQESKPVMDEIWLSNVKNGTWIWEANGTEPECYVTHPNPWHTGLYLHSADYKREMQIYKRSTDFDVIQEQVEADWGCEHVNQDAHWVDIESQDEICHSDIENGTWIWKANGTQPEFYVTHSNQLRKGLDLVSADYKRKMEIYKRSINFGVTKEQVEATTSPRATESTIIESAVDGVIATSSSRAIESAVDGIIATGSSREIESIKLDKTQSLMLRILSVASRISNSFFGTRKK